MTFNFKVVPSEVEGHTLIYIQEDGTEVKVFDSATDQDVVLISYLLYNAKKDIIDGEDFKNFIIHNHQRFPFLIIPKE